MTAHKGTRRMTISERPALILLLAVLSAVLVWSGIHPRDTFTWFLEVLPALLGVGILAATYPRFRFSMLVYVLVSLHAIILMIGGHYTYAEMPAFNWLRDTFGLSRNYYDRVGHFAQGFVPAIIAREFLLRRSPLRRGKLLFFIVVSICLAASAAYEFFEWWVSLAVGSAADAFLGTQGDVWDTQWDMFMALAGAMIAMLSLSGIHDRFLRGMTGTSER